MKIILEPTVTVVGHTVFTEHPVHKIPPDGTDAEKLGSFAAKGCYDSFSETGRANCANQAAVIESMHGSVLEHSHLSLFIEGITRGCSLELNRHRPFNISQRSTRYTKEEDAAIVLEPYYAGIFKKYKFYQVPDGRFVYPSDTDELQNDSTPRDVKMLFEFIWSSEAALKTYESQVGQLIALNPNKLEGFDLRKWARGKARNILPHGLETKGVWTNNYRGIRWFVELRSERHAEPEIRVLANKILDAARSYAPTYFQDFEPVEFDGILEWKPKYSKV